MKRWVWVLALAAGFGLAQKAQVVVPGGSTGGVYFFYGTAVAQIINQSGVAGASSFQTGGAYDNLQLSRDRTDPQSNTYYCAMTTGDAASVAFAGTEPRFKDKKADGIRILFVMYPNFLHVLTTQGSGIRVLQDLKGKRVSTGQPGSSSDNLAVMTLEGAGVRLDSLAKRERLPIAESVKALAEGTLDALFWSGGVPTGSVIELGQTLARRGQRMVILPIEPKSTTGTLLTKRFPGVIEPVTVSRSVYNTPSDVRGLATWNVFTCPKEMPDDLAYALTKAVFDNLLTLQTAVAAAKDTTPANGVKFFGKNFIPYHEGALRYYREKGLIK